MLGFACSAPCASHRWSRCRRALRRRAAGGGGRGGGAGAERAKELTAADCLLSLFVSLLAPSLLFRPVRRAAHAGSAKASVSISMNTRPSAPTRR